MSFNKFPSARVGTGDVNGPASSTDNAIVRWDGTSGENLNDSVVIISDAGAVTGVASIVVTGAVTTGSAAITGAATAASIAVGGTLVTSTCATFTSTTGALLLPRLTTTQRDALTATNGMIIYNTSTDKFQGRAAGAWADLN